MARGAKGPCRRAVESEEGRAAWRRRTLRKKGAPGDGLPDKLSQLRQKPGQKAKQEPGFRFYALYGRIYRQDVLEAAMAQVRAKRGAAGVDGVTFEQARKASGWPRKLAGATARGTAHEELSAAGGAASVHREGEWEAEAAGDPDDRGQGSANGHAVDPGADL
jgi:hypothetical protein